ncbi:hypothetical protein ACFSJY_14900 [Thalassotalea euphylliae]|uniref:hypothetical protein n=1 Tax=Thalassotalea euphylliae TaxID=1655234 RepID=UPI00363046CF
MHKFLMVLVASLLLQACVFVPERAAQPKNACGLSTELKTLKVVNLMDGDASFYDWQGEMISPLTLPLSAVISGTYVAVNNVYFLGEKQIRCG